ncbi:TetR/AcrR family transcriptional regulator C-terminal domain-containing protein [Pseudonocardia sp. MH-G8]|uniref:TetR/AcrR family transcriptional regulator C-terminal domain-containing protein n=1 Tax=Pseudonocardia sp. MH-G8 TaxID=1854588 RepID=UPI000BA022F8|nr:TetR/AcrR family transcriptional regulator C-terminal domain-containing protein [Pseudonocardia sp. MH-G8]OZM80248.1 GntR family transcriptional regulator [Pseudonocardia sp. MH-G8]
MEESPPYARIVADIRERIESGDLAPGDRVPSTREITRRWGVAMATASKALGVLRRDGLVRAERGSGTVVEARPGPPPGAGRPRRPSPDDGALAPERIVGVAIAIADREGLAGLSMRRVAADLGAATMALYRHVADKDDLVLRMLDAAIGEWRPPAHAPAGWRARLEAAARQLWALFRRHPWVAPAMSMTRPQPLAQGLAYSEWTLAALEDSGADRTTAFTAYLTLFNYVRGTAVNLEPEVEAEAASGLDPDAWMDTQVPTLRAIVADGAFPVFERMLSRPYDFDLDTLFEFGLQRLLDGFAALIEAPPQTCGGPDVTP